MKLIDAYLCVTCDEVFRAFNRSTCPGCGGEVNKVAYPISMWLSTAPQTEFRVVSEDEPS